MTSHFTYRFEFWGRDSDVFYGDMLDDPDADQLDVAYEVNEMYDKTKRFLEMFHGIDEDLRVVYNPDPPRLEVIQGSKAATQNLSLP